MQPVRDRNTENSKFDSGQTKNSNQDNIFIKMGNDKTDAGLQKNDISKEPRL